MFQSKFYFYDTVNSTNDVAFELLKNEQLNENNCVVVTAKFQTKGRGRNNKVWFGNKNENLFYTFGINHSAEKIPLHLFQMIGGIAVFTVLNEIFQSKTKSENSIFRLKYPNDIYGIDSSNIFKKVSGLISETIFINSNNCSSIIGIGINVNQIEFSDEIAQNCTSLKLLNIEISFDELVEKLTSEIINLLEKSTFEIRTVWKSLINLDKKKIALANNSDTVDYYLKDFLEDGRLFIASDSGTEKIIDNGDSIKYDLF